MRRDAREDACLAFAGVALALEFEITTAANMLCYEFCAALRE